MAKKTDNHNPEAKLALRRYFLEKYHADGSATVFDGCQGGGVMWTAIRRTHPVASYWGVDVKPKKGRVKIDSARVLQQPGLTQNVIDVDTYGSPWKHWLALLPNLVKATTVFLTIGQNKMVGGFQGAPPKELVAVLGIPERTPPSISAKLWDLAAQALLAQAEKACTITEAVESVSRGNARYIGVRLEPKNDGPQVATASRQHTSVAKELKHV